MRWFYLALIIVFVGAMVIFALQNMEVVSMSFLAAAISAPLAVVIFVVYLLGAATGGSLFALLRRSVQGSRRAP